LNKAFSSGQIPSGYGGAGGEGGLSS